MRSMPGIQPTVDTVVWREAMPTSGRRSAASRTAPTFISGSPIPMKITLLSGSLRRKCRAWSRISDAVRLRPNFIRPVAQNVHVSGQPDWLDTQSERRPSRKRISTASTGRRSWVWKSAFSVPSAESASRSTASVERGSVVSSSARSSAGTLVMSS